MKFLPQLTWQSSSNFFYLTNNTQLSLIPSVHPTQSSSGCIHTTSTQLSLISLSLIPLPQCKSPKPKKKKKKKIMWILTAWVQTPSLQRADIFLTSHSVFHLFLLSNAFSLFSIKSCKSSLFCPISFSHCAACNFCLHFQYAWVSFFHNDFPLG